MYPACRVNTCGFNTDVTRLGCTKQELAAGRSRNEYELKWFRAKIDAE